MKKLFTIIILVSVMVSGYSQINCKYCPGILLGKTYKQVEHIYTAHQREFSPIEVSDTILGYQSRNNYTVHYKFKQYKKTMYCIESSITLDCMSGEELIGSHINDWQYIADNKWLYETPNYDIPLTVTLIYKDDKMVFKYNYVPLN